MPPSRSLLADSKVFLDLFKVHMTLSDVKLALFSKLFIYLSVNGILMIISRSKKTLKKVISDRNFKLAQFDWLSNKLRKLG